MANIATFGAVSAEAVTPSDTVNLSRTCRAIWVGVAGNVAVVFDDDVAVTFTGVAIGVLEVQAKRINSTNTTATTMVAMF